MIYETVTDPDLWSEMTARLKTRFAAQSFWMFCPPSMGTQTLLLSDAPMRMYDGYTAHYHLVDITVQAVKRDPHAFLNRVLRERDVVSEGAWLGSEIYCDLAFPCDVAQLMGTSLGPSSAEGPLLSFFRAPGAPLFDDATVQGYERIVPHLKRAVRLRKNLVSGLRPLPGWSVALLDQIAAGLFLLDGQGRLLHANSSGAALLDRRDGLVLRQGRLVGTDRAGADRLEAIIRACTTGMTQAGEMRLPCARGHWLLRACPLAHDATVFDGVGPCRAWLWVTDPAAERSDLPRRMQAIFGLTAAEQRVAAAMPTGLTSAEIAERYGLSLATVRSQVQSIFGRLGVRRQADMIRLMAQVSALQGP